MPTFSGLTLTQLRAATAAQIVTAMTTRLNMLTKRQLIRLDLLVLNVFDQDAVVTLPDSPTVTQWPDGQIKRMDTISRDELGAKTGTRRVDHTYYPPEGNATQGPVDMITCITLDAADVVVGQTELKHFPDGRQPVLTVVV